MDFTHNRTRAKAPATKASGTLFAPSGALMMTTCQNSSRNTHSQITKDTPVAHNVLWDLHRQTIRLAIWNLSTLFYSGHQIEQYHMKWPDSTFPLSVSQKHGLLKSGPHNVDDLLLPILEAQLTFAESLCCFKTQPSSHFVMVAHNRLLLKSTTKAPT